MIMTEMRLLRLQPISQWYQGLGKCEQTIMNPVQMLSACSEQISPWEIITEINLVLPGCSKISLSCLPKTVFQPAVTSASRHLVLWGLVRHLSLEMSKGKNLRTDCKSLSWLRDWQFNHWRDFRERFLGLVESDCSSPLFVVIPYGAKWRLSTELQNSSSIRNWLAESQAPHESEQSAKSPTATRENILRACSAKCFLRKVIFPIDLHCCCGSIWLAVRLYCYLVTTGVTLDITKSPLVKEDVLKI